MSASISSTEKPTKPSPDFPLFPHATGRWAKKVKGKLHYFGPWSDPDGALRRWLEVKEALLAKHPVVEALEVAATKAEARLTLQVQHRQEGVEPTSTPTVPVVAQTPPQTGRKKRKKPSKDFPLFRHATGRWCKKVHQRFHYFGKISDDPEGKAALDEWLRIKDDLLAGRHPRAKVEGTTLRELCNYFMDSKAAKVATGELQTFTLNEYHRACGILVKFFGPSRVAADITPQDFTTLRIHIAKGIGLAEVGKRVQMVRSVFKYGIDNGHIRTAILFGSDFKRPSSKVMRRLRGSKPKKLFTADEVRALIGAADQPLRSMTLLAINAGYGQTDLATLPKSAVDLKAGWIHHARPKTGVPRRCPLWPETIEALREALAQRPEPKDAADADLCFVTKYRNRWVKYTPSTDKAGKGSWTDSIGLEFGKVLKALQLEQTGRRFYSLRHTFRTIADKLPDRPAIDYIMGHLPPETDMRGRYVHNIDDARLKAVSDHVRRWLYPKPARQQRKAVETPLEDTGHPVDSLSEQG